MSGRHAHPQALIELRDRWMRRLDQELSAAIALRHELHAHPDLSGREGPTTARVVAAIGVGEGTTVAETGRVLRLGPVGPAVGMRAELDALPLLEATGAGFTATGPAMHACGHDVHLAALTALARATGGIDLPAGLVIVLQPREEVAPTGAHDVLDAGVLAAMQVRYLIGAHVQPQLAASTVSADPGAVNAAVDEIEIEVIGRGGHGAYPHLALDPVPVLCRIVLDLQDAARSAVDPMQPVVVSVTQLAGAGAPNIIPDTARAAGTIRTMRPQDAAALHAYINRLVVQSAAAHGCTGSYVVRRGDPALINDQALARATRGWLTAIDQLVGSFASCGSDDFATYGTALPILMSFVGTAEVAGTGPMLHDSRFLPADERVRDVAVALMSGWLAAVQLLAEAGEVQLPTPVVALPATRG